MRRELSVVALSACLAAPALADVLNNPPHPHGPSPVTTWANGTLPSGNPDPARRHQHRTNHDPMQGVMVYGAGAGAQAYRSNLPGQVWVGRVLEVQGGVHPGGNTEALHGHQGHEIDFGRFDVHPAVAGGDISAAEAAAWNTNAANMASWAFGSWNTAGTASGTTNWPGGDDDTVNDPNGTPWHSSIDWRSTAFNPTTHNNGSAEVHVSYGEAGALGSTGPFTGGHNSLLNLVMDDDADWFYGLVAAPGGAEHDFASTILHEAGHAIGLDHFGNGNNSYVMKAALGVGVATRVIDPDAIHGARDLYAIPGIPAPGAVALLLLGGAAATRRRRD